MEKSDLIDLGDDRFITQEFYDRVLRHANPPVSFTADDVIITPPSNEDFRAGLDAMTLANSVSPLALDRHAIVGADGPVPPLVYEDVKIELKRPDFWDYGQVQYVSLDELANMFPLPDAPSTETSSPCATEPDVAYIAYAEQYAAPSNHVYPGIKVSMQQDAEELARLRPLEHVAEGLKEQNAYLIEVVKRLIDRVCGERLSVHKWDIYLASEWAKTESRAVYDQLNVISAKHAPPPSPEQPEFAEVE